MLFFKKYKMRLVRKRGKIAYISSKEMCFIKKAGIKSEGKDFFGKERINLLILYRVMVR